MTKVQSNVQSSEVTNGARDHQRHLGNPECLYKIVCQSIRYIMRYFTGQLNNWTGQFLKTFQSPTLGITKEKLYKISSIHYLLMYFSPDQSGEQTDRYFHPYSHIPLPMFLKHWINTHFGVIVTIFGIQCKNRKHKEYCQPFPLSFCSQWRAAASLPSWDDHWQY